MKEFKGTKGEWYCVEYAGRFEIQDEPFYKEGKDYLSVDGDLGVGREEAEANAKLIAAAPDLLKALQELSEAVSFLDAVDTRTALANKNSLKAINKALEK